MTRVPLAAVNDSSPHRSGLWVLDYWEKLAGASLALSAIIRLCQRTDVSLVVPWVHSSLFLPGRSMSGPSFPFSAYYDLASLRQVLLPQRLIDTSTWHALARSWGQPGTNASHAKLLIVVYNDFTFDCRLAMTNRDIQDHYCPTSCVAQSGVRRMMKATTPWVGDWSPQQCVCVLAAELRAAISTGSGRAVAVLRSHRAVALLNFRRHDDGRPMLSQREAQGLRLAAIRPSNAIHAAARRFLLRHGIPTGSYTAVQLRSNHLAHASYLAATAAASFPPAGSVCAQRLLACTRRLGRSARRLASPAVTVIASDISTLHRPNQDAATHRRKGYMRDCLIPSLPSLLRWQNATGRRVACATWPASSPFTTSGMGRTLRAMRATSPLADVWSESATRACDAGWLGLLDLVLASEAASFAAIEVRKPFPSAYLEWIVQLRAARHKSSELLRC